MDDYELTEDELRQIEKELEQKLKVIDIEDSDSDSDLYEIPADEEPENVHDGFNDMLAGIQKYSIDFGEDIAFTIINEDSEAKEDEVDKSVDPQEETIEKPPLSPQLVVIESEVQKELEENSKRQQEIEEKSAIILQRHIRGWLVRNSRDGRRVKAIKEVRKRIKHAKMAEKIEFEERREKQRLADLENERQNALFLAKMAENERQRKIEKFTRDQVVRKRTRSAIKIQVRGDSEQISPI